MSNKLTNSVFVDYVMLGATFWQARIPSISMSIKYTGLVTQSLARQIADQLREAILRGDLQVNDRLPTEEDLAARFAVSRPTVREALKRLGAQNLVRSQRGPSGGTFVNRPDQAEVREALSSAATLLMTLGEFDFAQISEAREALESLCCRLAVARREDHHLAAMAREIQIQESEIDEQEFCASDVRFHRALVDACANPVLQFVMFAVIEALQPVATMTLFRFRERAVLVDQHRRLYAALRERDEATALAVLAEQMHYLARAYGEAQAWREQKAES